MASRGHHYRSKRYAPAEALLALALEKRERKLGKDHKFTLITMNSLALIYKSQGRYQEAETLYKRTLESSERTLGKQHPFTVSTVRALYKAQGRKAEAEPLFQRAQGANVTRPARPIIRACRVGWSG